MFKKYILLASLFLFVSLGTVIFLQNQKTDEKNPPVQKNNSSIQDEKEDAPSSKFPSEHPDSIPNMSQKEYHADNLKLGSVLDDNSAYTRYTITYESEGFTISGIMNIPKGEGPFPLLILNHGYIDPKVYTNGQGLKREQDFLARAGYAVLHSDYRSHAFSDQDPKNEIRPRAGYVEDVINAILAVQKSDLPELKNIDKNSVGMLGHSMGGGITENIMVIRPDIAKAYVLLAPINSDYKINFNKWVRSDWSDTAQEFLRLYGEPEENPTLWDGISARNYFEKVSAPVMLHQGTLDDQVPLSWSQELAQLLESKNKDITYFEYPGEGHTFASAQNLVMNRTLEFLNQNLKK